MQSKSEIRQQDIETHSKPALNILSMAFKEIELGEKINPKKLTAIQRNRMAIQFLDMND